MGLKKQNGFAMTDAVISVVVLTIFATIIVTISYNIYVQANFIKRNNTATNYIVDLFEYAKTIDLSDVNYATLAAHFSGDNDITVANTDNGTTGKKYTMIIEVQNTNEFVKQIDATVRYKLAGKTKSINMSTLINK